MVRKVNSSGGIGGQDSVCQMTIFVKRKQLIVSGLLDSKGRRKLSPESNTARPTQSMILNSSYQLVSNLNFILN